MVAACRGVAEARRDSGREARFRASGGQSVRGEESEPMKKLMSGLAIAAIASTAFVGAASAQDIDTASTGNGGVSNANSNGGAVTVGDTNNGGNAGTSGSVGGTIDLTGITTSDDLAAQIIARVLGQIP
jgi:hypothetical protein